MSAIEPMDDPYERREREADALVSEWAARHAVTLPAGAAADLRLRVTVYAHDRVDQDRAAARQNRAEYDRIMGGKAQ